MVIDIQRVPRFVINLESRTDRLTRVKSEMHWLFEDPTFELFRGIEHPEEQNKERAGMRGCGESHTSIIKMAKERGYEQVLIMEDDCVFQAKGRTLGHATTCFKNVEDDWDMLSGGIYQGGHLTGTNEYWWRTGYFSSTHFYLLRNTAYDTVLENYDPNEQHIDRFLSNYYGKCNINCYVPKTMFATQNPGYSNIVTREVDYTYMLTKNGLNVL
jgi:hypothetical protein